VSDSASADHCVRYKLYLLTTYLLKLLVIKVEVVIFTARRYVSMCLFVRLYVRVFDTRQCSIKTAKHRIK